MRILLKNVAILLIICLITSCDFNGKPSDNNKLFSLKIVMDSTMKSLSYYGQSILETGNDTIFHYTEKWNRDRNELIFKCDSLKSGEYQFKIKTVYHHPRILRFSLKSDTVITIQHNFQYQSVNIIPKKYLLNSDTIDFAFNSYGCCVYIRRYQLIKLKKQYRLIKIPEYGCDSISSLVSFDIIEDLYRLQKLSRKNKYKTGTGFYTHNFILIAGQKAFIFDDKYKMESFYDAFLEKYDKN